MAQTDLRIPFTAPDLSGGVTVAHQVIAKLAGKTARATYGVVAMQESPIRKLARFFRGALSEGVELDVTEGRVDIGLHVVMERGVNIAQVTANWIRGDAESMGGLNSDALATANVTMMLVRSDNDKIYPPGPGSHLEPSATERAIARTQIGSSARTGVDTAGNPVDLDVHFVAQSSHPQSHLPACRPFARSPRQRHGARSTT